MLIELCQKQVYLRYTITLLIGCLWLMIKTESQWTVDRLSSWATYYTFGVFVTSGRWKWPGQGKLDEMKENLAFAFYHLLKSRGVAFIAAGLVFPACKQFSVFSLQFSWAGLLYCIPYSRCNLAGLLYCILYSSCNRAGLYSWSWRCKWQLALACDCDSPPITRL